MYHRPTCTEGEQELDLCVRAFGDSSRVCLPPRAADHDVHRHSSSAESRRVVSLEAVTAATAMRHVL